MTRIYLIRHAEAEGNIYRRIHGHYESSVTLNGLRQIKALAKRFAGVPIDACYASDLIRTRTTAQSITLSHNLPLHCDPRFREANVGIWEDTPFGAGNTGERYDVCLQPRSASVAYRGRRDLW